MEPADHRPAWGRACSKGCLIPQRIIVAIMGFIALICAYTNRVSISHVLTKLVIPRNHTGNKEEVCPPEVVSAQSGGYPNVGIFHWSEGLQGLVLGVFYIGYLITHMPGGILADRFGAKWVLFTCMLVSGLCTMFSPLAIQYGEQWGLMAIRILMGLAQGPVFPAMTSFLSAWVPAKERGALGTFTYSGITVGTIVSNISSGQMLFYFHWSVTLYVLGFSTLLWCLAFIFTCTSTPATHFCIKPKEMAYLEEQIPKKPGEKPKIPWKPMMCSSAMAALIVSQIGHDWGYYVMVSILPKYMADVLQFSIRSNGWVTSLPFAAMFISTILCGVLADWLIRTKRLSITVERKIFTFIGAVGPGMFMVIASYAGCNKTLVVFFFTLSMFLMGAYYAGQKLTPLDMSPTFAGTIMAITNGLGSFAGLFSPPIVGLMTPHAAMNEWRGVFWLGFAILCFSAIIFAIWGTGDVQSYDPTVSEKKE